MPEKIDGKLVVVGAVPTTSDELSKSLSSGNFSLSSKNFQTLGGKPVPASPAAEPQAPASPAPAPASTGATAKP